MKSHSIAGLPVLILLLAGLFAGSSGCIFRDSAETRVYDLIPAPCRIPAGINVQVENFEGTSARYRMLSRKGNELIADPSAKWAVTPERMLAKSYAAILTPCTGKMERKRLSGTVLAFERVLPDRGKDPHAKAVLSVRYRVRDSHGKDLWSGTLTDEAALKDLSAEEFASVMGTLFSRQAEKLFANEVFR